MNQEHGPKDIRTNNSGATYDINKELSGAQNSGTYFDSENGRVSSSTGNKGAWEKIKGEIVSHSNIYPGDWFNMCSITVEDDTFELWVEKNNADSPYFVVNGVVMGKSDKMPWLYNHRVQFDKNEACIGGEIFLTDYNVSPSIFNIQDIKDNFSAGTKKYFDDFNYDLFSINLSTALDIPIFKELVNVGGGGGLPVGSYQYSIRYINESGDASNWGPLTPAIPVVQSLSPSSSQYPGIKTYGGPADLNSKTAYGVRLRFRITNINNYDYLEVRRLSYNFGGGVDFVPAGTIVAKIQLDPGEISVRDFIDPKESNVNEGTLADNEEVGQLSNIEKAKAIRYFDKRVVLMNFSTPSKVADVEFKSYNGKKIFPIVENLGKLGFNDPKNHVYRKNYLSNEKYSFAVSLFDGIGGTGFSAEDDDLKNVQAPSRRDPMDADSKNFSYSGNSVAANVNSSVGNTFEIFSHENAIIKTDKCSYKNIMKDGRKVNVHQYCNDNENFGMQVKAEEVGYKPFTPTDAADDTSGHNYIVNVEVEDSNTARTYRPKAFGCDYYSRGFALGGIENIPSWAKSFSIVRSARAERVVCQGIGMYSLNQGDFNLIGNKSLATKEKNKLWFHSPDIASGIVNQATIDDMSVNPQNYKIQISSPLGFFSEVYNFENNTAELNRDRIIDMITYARIIRDNGQINPGETPSMGVNGYVAYNRYRNSSNSAGQGSFAIPDSNGTTGGNRQFQLKGFSTKTDGREVFYEIESNENIYNVNNVGGSGKNDFDDQGMKDFTEPFYIINIIRTGAEVQDLNINSYYSTGHYQKVDSIIGLGDDSLNQSFVLVDERWEDCIPNLIPNSFNSTGESFVYLVDKNSNERACLNVTFYTPAQISAILTDISSNGFHTTTGGKNIKGIYTHSVDSTGEIFIKFNHPSTVPTSTEKVIVRYDNSRPIRFFGGDTVVGENIFAPIDREANGTIGDKDKQFQFNIAFPYRRFKMNPRYFIARETTGLNKIQDFNNLRLGYLRQLCVMYACESISDSALSHNGGTPLEFFPLKHYVQRPGQFDDSSFGGGNLDDIADDNNMSRDYFDDYPGEYNFWKFGGFKFEQNYNSDYAVKGPSLYFSKPKVGFKEENHFCTGITWSLSRAINQQDSPGLKTFLGTSRFYADDDNGEIKKAWDSRTDGKGDNLYAICESGVLLLLTKKNILSNLTADDLSIMASDSFIGDQLWLSRTIGSNDEMWRGMAEASVELRTDSGRIERECLYIPNRHSIYRLMDNSLMDIAKDNYHARLYQSLNSISPTYGSHITGFFNKKNNEYWLQVLDVEAVNPGDQESEGQMRCFVYDQNESKFIGRFHYSFDSYLNFKNKNYGFRNGQRFELDQGFIINGQPIEAYLLQHSSVGINTEKEFISIEVNTGLRGQMKPTEVVFLDESLNELCRTNETLFGPKYMYQYDGWFSFIPRKEVTVSASRDRVQYRLILWKILHNFEEDFRIVSSVVQYKPIK